MFLNRRKVFTDLIVQCTLIGVLWGISQIKCFGPLYLTSKCMQCTFKK
jgi:hypothetical protein